MRTLAGKCSNVSNQPPTMRATVAIFVLACAAAVSAAAVRGSSHSNKDKALVGACAQLPVGQVWYAPETVVKVPNPKFFQLRDVLLTKDAVWVGNGAAATPYITAYALSADLEPIVNSSRSIPFADSSSAFTLIDGGRFSAALVQGDMGQVIAFSSTKPEAKPVVWQAVLPFVFPTPGRIQAMPWMNGGGNFTFMLGCQTTPKQSGQKAQPCVVRVAEAVNATTAGAPQSAAHFSASLQLTALLSTADLQVLRMGAKTYYVFAGDGGGEMVEVTASSITHVATFGTGTNDYNSVQLFSNDDGDRFAVFLDVANAGLHIYSLADLSKPKLLSSAGQALKLGAPRRIAFVKQAGDDLVLMTSSTGMTVFDVNQPAEPVVRGCWAPHGLNSLNSPYSVQPTVVDGRLHAIISAGQSLYAVAPLVAVPLTMSQLEIVIGSLAATFCVCIFCIFVIGNRRPKGEESRPLLGTVEEREAAKKADDAKADEAAKKEEQAKEDVDEEEAAAAAAVKEEEAKEEEQEPPAKEDEEAGDEADKAVAAEE
eukprot:PLAT8210.1.p2 GENE.PLAT8210.1~~PLAT8210.1.p2  ORF type:complete len:539 (-),score=247.13 PLAT8210.1:104-1720(-)